MNETPPQNQPPAPPPAVPPAPPPAPTPEPPPPPMAEPPHDQKPKKGMPKSPFLYALLAFLLGLGVAYVLITQFPNSKVAETGSERKAAKVLALPGDAIKVQECVAQKGELHAKPGDLPYGPIFMVNKDKVVGLEYVLSEEDFNKGKIYDQLNTLDGTVNHMQVATMSADFSGKQGKYFVIDLYTVDQKTKQAIECDIPSPTIPEASPSATISSTPQVSTVPQTSPTLVPVVSQVPTVAATMLSQ